MSKLWSFIYRHWRVHEMARSDLCQLFVQSPGTTLAKGCSD
jgi:hypothetical protein